MTGQVKWFDDTKGFGFVASEDGGKDVFVHISILGPAGIPSLAEGQQVNMRVVDTPKGREAISLRSDRGIRRFRGRSAAQGRALFVCVRGGNGVVAAADRGPACSRRATSAA